MSRKVLYFSLAIVVSLLGILALYEWRKVKNPSLPKQQRKIAEQMALGRFPLAEKNLTKLKRRSPHDVNVQLLHIQLLRLTDRHDEALTETNEALQYNRDCLLLMRERAKLLLDTDPHQSCEDFRRCRAILRDQEDLIEMARAYYHADDLQEAKRILTPLLDGSERPSALILGGDLCFSDGRYSEAIALYRRAQEIEKLSHEMLFRLGHCYRQLKRYTEAQEAFDTILNRDPDNIPAKLAFGACLEARSLYTKALEVYKDDPHPKLKRQSGICYVHLERFFEAESLLAEALEEGEHSAQTLAFLGYALERQQKWQAAESIYRQLTHDFPEHIAGYRGLAWLFGVGLSKKITLDQALSLARHSVQLLPDSISWEVLSACEARAGNFDGAHHIQEALSAKEKDRDQLTRRRAAMRNLRRGLPLDETLVPHALVA